MKWLRASPIATVLLLAACTLPSRPNDETVKITAARARDIADQKLASAGMNGVPWTFVEFYSNPENRCLTHEIDYLAYQARVEEIKEALANRRYYLVMYEPGTDVMFGSAICVFVDEAGDVLYAARL